MSKLYPARAPVAVEVAPRPALLRSWTESPPAAQHLRRGRCPQEILVDLSHRVSGVDLVSGWAEGNP